VSAPTALETGALARGIAWRIGTRPVPPTVHGYDRRAQDPLSRLGREHDTLCRGAADPDEIAAVLEAAGVDDRAARARYGVAGTFEVAEELWHRVPWRPTPDEPAHDLWRLPLWRAVLRGLVYVLPPLLAALALDDTAHPSTAPVLLAATALTIAGGQALSVLGHVLVGRGRRPLLASLTTLALGGSVVTGAAAVAATAAAGGPVALAVAAAGQLVFVLAATLLIVQGLDLLLVATVVPGTAAAAAVLVSDVAPGPASRVFVAAAMATVGLAALAAASTGARVTLHPVRLLDRGLGTDELHVAGTAALHGLGLTALAAGPLAAVVTGRTSLSPGDVALASLPLTATLGTAEYLLHRARRRSLAEMVLARDLVTFRRASGVELRGMLLRHLVVAAGVAGVVLSVAGARPALALVTATYAVLAAALLLATTLMSLGRTAVAARLSLTGGVVLVTAGLAAPLRDVRLATAQLAVVAVLLAVAYGVTAGPFAQTSAHR
jgi:hypothetical protein